MTYKATKKLQEFTLPSELPQGICVGCVSET